MAIIISYIPALHDGYIKFIKAHPASILVLGTELVRETPRLDRDIRALEPAIVARMLTALDLAPSIAVLDSIDDLAIDPAEDIIMPDEDVNRNFASTHLADYNVIFIPTFLRWDRPISTTEFEVPVGRTVSTNALDHELLAKAELEAAKSPDWWRQVGALIARDGKVLLAAHNRPFKDDDYNLNIFGDPRSNFDAGESFELTTAMHAESHAIARAARDGLALRGASIYVTTFPCPVCAKLIAAAGIAQVYYSKGYSLVDAEDILKAQNIELILVDNEKPSTR